MPQYYTKFPAILYTWLINDSKVVGGNSTEFEIRVEKKSAFDKITCKATELLESTSDDFYLEPLCKLYCRKKRLVNLTILDVIYLYIDVTRKHRMLNFLTRCELYFFIKKHVLNS